ncbi:MAG: ABC transporter permease [Tissierellia bacterium]|nr:ABC transporter permease [Tissierellia bacterium]
MKKIKPSAVIFIFWTAVFILIPLLLVVALGFTINQNGTAVFSLDNFRRFFTPIYLQVLWRSLKLAFYSTLICLLLGYPFAYFIAKKKNRDIYMLFVLIPMWMNFLLRTYAWISLLGRNGLVNRALAFLGLQPMELMYNNMAILIGMVYNFLPFMILPIYTSLTKLDYSLVEAGYDLGAGPGKVFRKIILPLTKGGILTGVTMSFIPAVSTFVISQLLGGNNFSLIGNIIEQQFRFTNDWNFGSAISLILMALILILIRFSMKNEEAGSLEGGLL